MITSSEKIGYKSIAWLWWLPVIVVSITLIAIYFSRSRTPRKTEEVVTIDSSRHVVIPVGTPVAVTRELKMQDRDVETIGDRIAEATFYLKRKQSAAALRALQQAQLATNHAITLRERGGIGDKEMVFTLNELTSAERSIQRGAIEDATRQLNALNRRLDTVAR